MSGAAGRGKVQMRAAGAQIPVNLPLAAPAPPRPQGARPPAAARACESSFLRPGDSGTIRRLMIIQRLLLASVLLGAAARADEGMWTFDQFPSGKVEEKYGFAPGPAWLERVRLSSARMADGCSASFVSPDGLVMFNHHCAAECIEQLSTASRNYLADGFWARTLADEVTCPAMEIDQLTELSDATDRVSQATAGLSGAEWESARKRAIAELEGGCAGGRNDVRCEVVSLYQGGRYGLYRYRRYQDVRLVFAPEAAVANFGGDPDNFMFPRWDLDVSFVRVYQGGRPARTDSYFRWSRTGAREGELTFVSGNPGTTARDWTVAQLEYERDVALPERMLRLAELRGLLTEFARRGLEQKRISQNLLELGVENSLKARRGGFEALVDKAFFATKAAAEQDLRARVMADPELAREVGGAWDAVARALEEQRRIRKRLEYVGFGRGFDSQLFRAAQELVRAAEERRKDSGSRLEEYSDARLPELEAHLFSTAPVYRELEIVRLTFSLTKLREALGPDDPFARTVLGRKSPRQLATELVNGTRLGTDRTGLALRRRLWNGGTGAVQASTDPMIRFARLVDPEARALRKHFEDDIESVLKKNDTLIARARFRIFGTSTYPDATFTPRLSYGSVEGYVEDGRRVEPFTTFGGAFERATGRDPFRLPASWLRARDRLHQGTPFNFCTSNDIVGGNSGSPVIDRGAEIVGLIFDGNIQSLGGDYGFDAAVNRAVAVDARAILEALEKVYRADRLVRELRGRGG